MRLATRNDATRDGELFLVDSTHDRCVSARPIAGDLQEALDRWEQVEPLLLSLDHDLARGKVGEACDASAWGAPLPRAYEWVDGSAFIHHIELVRKARGAALPEGLCTDPLVYQGGSSRLLGPREPVVLVDETWGLDFEAEVAVILGDTPRGCAGEQALDCVRLVLLANDWTLRELVPSELAKGFGFFVSKPATAFSPLALTPDELGEHWREGRLCLPLRSYLNDSLVGEPTAAEMHFSFADLITHIARTREFGAGTILGSGTVSNRDPARGVSCLAERRTLEKLDFGEVRTPYLTVGDRVRIEMRDPDGRDLFGCIEQEVIAPST